jgi:peptidoglycan-associated lipoprotein
MKLKIFIIAISIFFIGCSDKKKVKPSNVTNSSETVTIDGGVSSISSDGSGGNAATYNNSYGGLDGSSGGLKSIYFEFGQYSISSDMQERIEQNSNIIKTKNKIKIEGNCDEFGTDEYNFALGLKRAKIIKDDLMAKGVEESKIVMISLGESTPLCRETTDECYAKNRRVDFHIIN